MIRFLIWKDFTGGVRGVDKNISKEATVVDQAMCNEYLIWESRSEERGKRMHLRSYLEIKIS